MKYAYAGRLLVQETDRNGLSFYWGYDGRSSHARCIRTCGDGGIYVRLDRYRSWIAKIPGAKLL